MIPRYSIAETRNRFAEIVHELRRTPRIHVTRRGHPVAVLISVEEYERLLGSNVGFWEAYSAFRAQHNLQDANIDPGIFDVRDPSTGREISW